LSTDPRQEQIRRILHDFVILRLQDRTPMGQVHDLISQSTDKINRLFADDQQELEQINKALAEVPGFAPGAIGVRDLVVEVKRLRRNLDEIRGQLPPAYRQNMPQLPKVLADAVKALTEKAQQGEQAAADARTYEQMRQALEDAGFSPDVDGLKALVVNNEGNQELAERIRGIVRDNAPKLAVGGIALASAVGTLAGWLHDQRIALEFIQQRTNNALNSTRV
jgi:hypothetical protein